MAIARYPALYKLYFIIFIIIIRLLRASCLWSSVSYDVSI